MTKQDERSSDANRISDGDPIRGLVVGTFKQTADKETCREHLDELIALLKTHGNEIVGEILAPLRGVDPATLLGAGKLEEIGQLAKDRQAQLIVFDDELTPPQQRNLEKLFRLPVIDRTEVILRVFDLRAQTKEARLQVELAFVQYQAPRLTKMWTHLSRQRGGGINQKGEGESQLEIDRRLLRRKMQSLEVELKGVAQTRQLQQSKRERAGVPEVAIVGYTNAGKSTLMNLLTNAGVFVEDKLFATLDTTTRRIILPNHQKILLTDTVGFLRKLPHMLVAAFRSTLEQSLRADLLLHIIDASNPRALQQLQATEEVLESLQAEKKPRLVILNKCDRAGDEAIFRLKTRCGRSLSISALHNQGIGELMNAISDHFEQNRQPMYLRLQPDDYALLHHLYETCWVKDVDFGKEAMIVTALVPLQDVSGYASCEISANQFKALKEG